MTDECEMPEPSPEHSKLMKSVGIWDVTAHVYMDPTSPPLVSQATDTVEAIGPFWLLSSYRGEFMGAPYRGQCQVGFDPTKGVYCSTWLDQMSPIMVHMEGNYDEAGTLLTLQGEGPGMTGDMCTWRLEQNDIDDDARKVRMFVENEGEDVLIMEWDYKRRA